MSDEVPQGVPPAEPSLIEALTASFAGGSKQVEILGRTVLAKPMSVTLQQTLFAMHPDDAGARHAEALIRNVVGLDGKPVFTLNDKTALRFKVKVTDVWPAIEVILGRSVEAQVKNSEAGGQ